MDVMNLPEPNKVYRVAQWATGRIGTSSLRTLIQSPQFDLVGVYVHSEEKDGRDAGELCGLPLVGIKATRNLDEIIALKPDCVVANMEGANVDDVCRLLEAGINVSTSRVDYLEPEQMDPEVRKRVEAACAKGNASIHASGASPGFSSEALPLVAAYMSRDIDCLTIDEFAEISASCPDFQCVAMGFGQPLGGEFNPHILEHASHGFRQSINVIAKGLGITLDGMTVEGEAAGANQTFNLPGGTPIEKGSMAAQRITVAGLRQGQPVIRYRLNWFVTQDNDRPDWKLQRSGWRLLLEGSTPVEILVSFPVEGEAYAPAMAAITANPPISAVPYLCAAKAGIRTTAELPLTVPNLG